MDYIVLSKDQLKDELHIEICGSKAIADNRRNTLINAYNDVVILSKDDYQKLVEKIFRYKIHCIDRRNNQIGTL